MQEQVLTFSKEEKEKLEIYSSLLKNWQKKFNLVSSASLMDIWQRHFVDSAQLYSLLPKEKKGAVVFRWGISGVFDPQCMFSLATAAVHLHRRVQGLTCRTGTYLVASCVGRYSISLVLPFKRKVN